MFLLKLPLFILTLWGLILNLDAFHCPKGQRVVIRRKKSSCEDCKSGQFQHEENSSQYCQTCRKCDEDSGSVVSQFCSRTSNTMCNCRKGFVASDSDYSTCECKAGFGKKSGECTECGDGYFSKSVNSPCQRWKQCKSGVNITGTKTSDIVCNDEKPQTGTDANVSPIPVKAVSSDTDHQPQETFQTQRLLTTTTNRQIQHPETSPSSTADPLGFLVTIATVGLLVLTAMIIKFYIGFYLEKHESVQKHESMCGRPVEEIGSGGEVSLKLTAEEN